MRGGGDPRRSQPPPPPTPLPLPLPHPPTQERIRACLGYDWHQSKAAAILPFNLSTRTQKLASCLTLFGSKPNVVPASTTHVQEECLTQDGSLVTKVPQSSKCRVRVYKLRRWHGQGQEGEWSYWCGPYPGAARVVGEDLPSPWVHADCRPSTLTLHGSACSMALVPMSKQHICPAINDLETRTQTSVHIK